MLDVAASRTSVALFMSGVAVGGVAVYWLRHHTAMDDESEDEDESDEDTEQPQTVEKNGVRDDYNADALNEPYKMLLIFNMELYKQSSKTGEVKAVKMSAGKAAAQSGHATLGAYRRGMKHCPNAVRDWLRIGQMKITVKCPTVEELLKLETDCAASGLNTYLIRDAGHTEIEPGSRTVLAVGPAPASVMNPLTGHLKPY